MGEPAVYCEMRDDEGREYIVVLCECLACLMSRGSPAWLRLSRLLGAW